MHENLSTPLPPPVWTTATHFSSGSLARLPEAPLHPEQRCQYLDESAINMNTSHPSCVLFTGSPSPLGLTTKSHSSLMNVCMNVQQCSLLPQGASHPKQSQPQTFVQKMPTFLISPRTKLCIMGDGAFSSAAPCLWSSLPDHLGALQAVSVWFFLFFLKA